MRWLCRKFGISPNSYYNYLKNSKGEYHEQREVIFERIKYILIKKMVKQQRDMKIPTNLVPMCPHCKKPLTMNLRADSTFVQDKGWYEAVNRYDKFEENHQKSNVVYLEIGVGYNTPEIIKYNFWQRVCQNPNALYACLNLDEVNVPDNIKNKSIWVTEDSNSVLNLMQ